ncbi:MAG: hypothetical protein ABSA93_30670 [Streptosporangiaceae bacterium]
MIDEAELRRMSHAERSELARILAKIELPKLSRDPKQVRRRRIGLILMMAVCLILAAWIAILILTLHRHFVVRHWPAVWVGLDLAELAAFAATAWAAWKQRQIVIVFMIITGTLLLCDAWFDLASSYGSREFTGSLLEAIFVELPLAFLMFAAARRLVRLTIYSSMRLQGISGPLPPLHRVPLFADGMEEVLPQRIREGAGSSP